MLLINDLARCQADSQAALTQAAADVIASGWFVMGENCSAFEDAFAAYVGAHAAIGVANGTDALELSMRALGVAPGTRVAMVANAGFYAAAAARAIGAAPLFVDVDRDTRLMSPDALDAALEGASNASAIVVTHLYGLLADMEPFAAIAARRGIALIEDCAQAHGARRGGKAAGSFGQAAAFSFYPTKNLGALGDGGAVCVATDELAERVRTLRQYGWSSKYVVSAPGGRNSRLDELQAAFLRVKLGALDAANARRRAVAAEYSSRIAHDRVQTPPVYSEESVAHLYVVTTPDRAGLAAHLKQAGVGSDIHYPVPDHRQPVLQGAAFAATTLPVTEELSQEVLTLPCHPGLTDDEVAQVIDAVNGW